MRVEPSPFALVGARLTEHGYSCVPIAPGTKAPGHIRGGEWRPMNDWGRFADRLPTRFELEIWCSYPDAGVGVICGGLFHLVGVDIDSDDADITVAISAAIPPTTIIKRGAKGSTRFYRGPSVARSKSWRLHGETQVADLIGPGRQSVLPPTIYPDTKAPYVWTGPDTLEDTDAVDLPELTPAHVAAIDEALRPFGYREPQPMPERPTTFVCSDARGREYALGVLHGCADELARQREPGRNSLLNVLSGRLGRYVARGWMSEDEAATAMWNGCVINSLTADDGERQFWATFQSGLRYGLRNLAPDPRERLTTNSAFASRIKNLK